MITIKIRKWAPIGGLEHTATSYQIASDADFKNLLDENLNDEENLTTYYSPVTVPVNVTYYIRVKRHFDDGTDSGWSDPVARKNKAANGGVLSNNKITVNKPIISVNEDEINNPENTTYTLTTSDFSGINDNHGYTIWIIENDKNEIIDFIKSTTNKTSITLNKTDLRLVNSQYVKFKAIHGTLTGIESIPGEARIDLRRVDFTIYVNNSVQSSFKDLTVHLDRKGNPNTVISKLTLSGLDNSVIYETSTYPSMDKVVIPELFLKPDTTYIVTGYGLPADDKHNYKITITTRPGYTLDKLDPTYKYSKTLSRYATETIFPVITNLVTNEVYNGKLLLPSAGTLKYGIVGQDGGVTVSSQGISGISLSALETENCLVKTISDNLLLVDTKTTNGHKLVTYNIDYYTNTANIKNYIEESGESISSNNGLVVINKDTIMVGIPGSDVLEKLDISGSSIVKTEISIPSGQTAIETILPNNGNNILVIFRDDINVYNYSLDSEIFEHKYILPLAFRKRRLKTINLINGDSLVIKPIQTETVDDEDVTDTEITALYFDTINNQLMELNLSNERTTDLKGSVLLNTGKVLLIKSENSAGNTLRFE